MRASTTASQCRIHESCTMPLHSGAASSGRYQPSSMDPSSTNFGSAMTLKCSAATADLCSMDAFTPWPKPYVTPPLPAPPSSPPPSAPPPSPRGYYKNTLPSSGTLGKGDWLVDCDFTIYQPPKGLRCYYAYYALNGIFYIFIAGVPPVWNDTLKKWAKQQDVNSDNQDVNSDNSDVWGWDGTFPKSSSPYLQLFARRPSSGYRYLFDHIKVGIDQYRIPWLKWFDETSTHEEAIVEGIPVAKASEDIQLIVSMNNSTNGLNVPIVGIWATDSDAESPSTVSWSFAEDRASFNVNNHSDNIDVSYPNCNWGGAAGPTGKAVPCSDVGHKQTCNAICASAANGGGVPGRVEGNFNCDESRKCECKVIGSSTCEDAPERRNSQTAFALR